MCVVFNVFCHRRSFLLSRSYSRLLLIRSFTSRLLWPLLTSVRSALLYAMVTSFKAYRTDLPGYHTFLSLHLSATFTIHDSVWLLGFDLFGSLTLTHGLMWFLFVRPEICPWLVYSHIRLPSDSTSRWTPLPSAISFPPPGGFRTCTG